jgi:hypothetical protein
LVYLSFAFISLFSGILILIHPLFRNYRKRHRELMRKSPLIKLSHAHPMHKRKQIDEWTIMKTAEDEAENL